MMALTFRCWTSFNFVYKQLVIILVILCQLICFSSSYFYGLAIINHSRSCYLTEILYFSLYCFFIPEEVSILSNPDRFVYAFGINLRFFSFLKETLRILTSALYRYAFLTGNSNHFGFKENNVVYKKLTLKKCNNSLKQYKLKNFILIYS